MPERPVIDEDARGTLRGLSLPPETQARLVGIALGALNERALTWATLMSAGALWGYVAFHPDPLRLIIAAGYSLLIVWPVLYTAGRRD